MKKVEKSAYFQLTCLSIKSSSDYLTVTVALNPCDREFIWTDSLVSNKRRVSLAAPINYVAVLLLKEFDNSMRGAVSSCKVEWHSRWSPISGHYHMPQRAFNRLNKYKTVYCWSFHFQSRFYLRDCFRDEITGCLCVFRIKDYILKPFKQGHQF